MVHQPFKPYSNSMAEPRNRFRAYRLAGHILGGNLQIARLLHLVGVSNEEWAVSGGHAEGRRSLP